MFPGDPIQQAFRRRPMGGPSGTPQQQPAAQPVQHPDYSLQFGPGQPAAPACDPCDLLTAIFQLLSANPDYRPWRTNSIPPDAKSFDRAITIGMPTQGAGETVVTRFTCNPGYDGIVLGISNNVFGPAFNPVTPDIIWRIRNGVSISNSLFIDGYDYITTQFGTTNYPRETSGIFVSSGQTLLYTVTNNSPTYPAGNAVQVTCCFRGFQWPSQRNGR
jgi:hypothetical protein